MIFGYNMNKLKIFVDESASKLVCLKIYQNQNSFKELLLFSLILDHHLEFNKLLLGNNQGFYLFILLEIILLNLFTFWFITREYWKC